MLQSMLVDRFRFAAHRESKEATVYDLVPAKNGPKLIRSAGATTDVPPTSVTFDKDGFVNQPPPPPDGRIEVDAAANPASVALMKAQMTSPDASPSPLTVLSSTAQVSLPSTTTPWSSIPLS